MPLCSVVRNTLLDTSINTVVWSVDRARLLSVGDSESGLWLQTLPSSIIGAMMDDSLFQLATSLRLGESCVAPHRFNCREAVYSLGHYGLSCRSCSAGRITRHVSINDIIRQALASAAAGVYQRF